MVRLVPKPKTTGSQIVAERLKEGVEEGSIDRPKDLRARER